MTWVRRTKCSDELLLYNLESFKFQTTMQASNDFGVVKEKQRKMIKKPLHIQSNTFLPKQILILIIYDNTSRSFW